MLFLYLYLLMPLSLLLLKHLIVDFYMQTPYMAQNKGTYGHWGGVLHALQHVAGTLVALPIAYFLMNMPIQFFLEWMVWPTLFAALFDGVVHYHMDWLKTRTCKKKGYFADPKLGCSMDQCKKYWRWMGLDQFVHAMTYVVIYAFVTAWADYIKLAGGAG